ncbi:hypothetical protein IAQ61_009153 [Plenodomus lingam]|uniref:uncharacterized protein n=1 Tax=Leptosphaeria maculans TaxID=5022 RepID=UPI00332DC981|nr:hypothetical protein IAQ61_009153 [Plenodomus lingam]
MADSAYDPTPWHSMPTASGASVADLEAPIQSSHALPFPQPYAPYAHMSTPRMMPILDWTQRRGENQVRSPYLPNGDHQMSYPTPPRVHPYDPSQPRPPPAIRSERTNWRPDAREYAGIHGLHTRSDYSRDAFYASAAFGYHPALPSAMESNPFARRPQNSSMGSNPPPYARQEPMRSPDADNIDSPRLVLGTHTRLSQHGDLSNERVEHGAALRRSSMFVEAQGRQSDHSNSPRTSSRRSFDRYSVDLPQSSTSSDADEAAARVPPSSRARQRMRGPRVFGQRQAHDPNVASPEQIQELKEKLPRRLPSELSEDTSKECDICSKDYSLVDVKPSEEAEIAIELPCGHCFGECCIHIWFETCMTHKNKVTCPMCRKQLIEPPRRPPRFDAARYSHAMLHAISQRQFGHHRLYPQEHRAEFPSM